MKFYVCVGKKFSFCEIVTLRVFVNELINNSIYIVIDLRQLMLFWVPENVM